MSTSKAGFESNEEHQNDSSQIPSAPSQTENFKEGSTATPSHECPLVMLREHAKGPYNIKNYFCNLSQIMILEKEFQEVKKIGYAIFVKRQFKGSYTRVESYLIDKSETWVRGCKNKNHLQVNEASRMVQETKNIGLGPFGIYPPSVGQTSRVEHGAS